MNDILDALYLTLMIMSPISFIWFVVDGYRNRRGIWWAIDKIDKIDKPTTLNNFYIQSDNTQINTDTSKISSSNYQKR